MRELRQWDVDPTGGAPTAADLSRHRTPIRKVSLKRVRENRLRSKLLEQRRGGPVRCEAQLPGCRGTVTDGHEIKTAGRGGSRIDLANIADLCRPCHHHITVNPSWSDRHGWTVPSTATPGDLCRARAIRSEHCCATTCPIDHREDA